MKHYVIVYFFKKSLLNFLFFTKKSVSLRFWILKKTNFDISRFFIKKKKKKKWERAIQRYVVLVWKIAVLVFSVNAAD
jgi:hypothetical protein